MVDVILIGLAAWVLGSVALGLSAAWVLGSLAERRGPRRDAEPPAVQAGEALQGQETGALR